MAIVYLDIDDEITSAASRMRTSGDARIALVLPAGSRLGTSRINFRLLAREAALHARNLSIVSPEAPTRGLALSAGLPVYASVLEYEGALAAPPMAAPADEPPERGVAGVTAGAGTAAGAVKPPQAQASPDASSVRGLADARSSAVAPPPAGLTPSPPVRPPGPVPPSGRAPDEPVPPVRDPGGASDARRGPSTAVIVALVLLVLLVGGGAVLGYLLLPSATVSVVVRREPLGPVDLTVTADPGATAVDPAGGVVSAERPTFDLTASGTFAATGKKVDETPATGSVRWQNCDPTKAYQVPRGTVVRTRGGIRFAIAESVFLPVAVLSGNPPAITCQTRDVGVTAAAPGEAGNVGAGTIDVVPASYNSVVIRVSNPAATSGGTHTETTLVSQKDVDAATKALTAKLDVQLRAILADPSRLPSGRVVFADTASRTTPVLDPDPATLVNQEVPGFDLSMTATGSVTAVDEASVTALATARLTGSVPAGRQLVDGSVRIDLGEPSVAGQVVRFPVSATAELTRPVDPVAVRRAVAGRTLEAARAAAAAFGDATVTVWPDWVTTVTTLDFRLAVDVRTDLPGSSPGPSPGPSASAATSPGAGAGSGGPPPSATP